jgi:hypothetical protein
VRRLAFAVCLFTACAPAVSTPGSGAASPSPDAPTSSPAPSATPAPSPSATPAPSPQQLSFFVPEQIVTGSRTPARRIEIPGELYDVRTGPDEGLLLLNPFTTWFDGAVRLLEIPTGRLLTVPLPANATHQYSFVGWLANGTLLITGREVWLGGPRGEGLHSVLQLFTHVASPSPSGRHVALWSPFADTIVILETATGSTRTIAGPFRRCAQDAAINISWSPDETKIAASDCDFENFTAPRTRFIDVESGRQAAVVVDAFVTAWLPSGDLIVQPVTRPSKQPSDPPKLRVVAPDGTLRRELPVSWGTLSPNGRYLAYETLRAAPTAADPLRQENVVGMVDLGNDRLHELGALTFGAWSARGELLILPAR